MLILNCVITIIKLSFKNSFSPIDISIRKVIQIFEKVGAVLIYSTQTTSINSGRNPNAIGKNDGHWDALYTKVENALLRN